MRRFMAGFLLLFMTVAMAGGPALAAGTDESKTSQPGATDDPRWNEAMTAVKAKRFEAAIPPLQALATKFPDNPDVYNYLGYSNSQLAHYDQAKTFYAKALALNPKHRGANEYLGELYLKLGDLPAAEERLAVLDGACFFGCDEYTELKAAIAEYKSSGKYTGSKIQ